MCTVYKFYEPGPIKNGSNPIFYKINENGCFICMSHWKDRDGYFKLERNGKEWLMHRYTYTIAKGEIPYGYNICHECDNPNCCNPEHLTAKTPRENMLDNYIRHRPIKKPHRLTEEEILEIETSKQTISQLAEKDNVSHSTIVRIRKKYKDKFSLLLKIAA